MFIFLKKFFLDGFYPGDYTGGTIHDITIILLIASCIIFPIVLYKKDKKTVYQWMRVISIAMLIVYFLRRIINIFNGSFFIQELWPFYLCNVNTIFLGLAIIFNWKWGKDFFITTGLIGGLFTFIMPQGQFTDLYPTFPIIDSVLSHYGIVVIPLVLLLTKTHVLEFKNIWKPFVGLLIVLFNVEVIQRLVLDTYHDFLFINSTLPFTIPGVPQFFIISALAIVLISLLYVFSAAFVKLTNRLEKTS
jgi:uncharacterized membrane protein YwaF